ncbi:MAG: hypothetical protein Q9M32_04340 [Sulfurimonas sp.]|nr:hypothetical protein [Sulfurimonas sp.]MDQ7061958.1 hypothetical protein [Sulfurimonas sp.]
MNTIILKKIEENKALSESYKLLTYFEEIDKIMKTTNIDKQRLSKLVSILKENSFESEAFKLEIQYSEIESIIDEKIKPYEKSFYEAGLILEKLS